MLTTKQASKQASWKFGKGYTAKEGSMFSVLSLNPPTLGSASPLHLLCSTAHMHLSAAPLQTFGETSKSLGRKEGSSFPQSASLCCSSEGAVL